MQQRAGRTDHAVLFAAAPVVEEIPPGGVDAVHFAQAVEPGALVEVDGEGDGEFRAWDVVDDGFGWVGAVGFGEVSCLRYREGGS